MTSNDESNAFSPPGPGGWKRLADHFPDALTPEYQLLYARTAPVGMATYMARYGVLARSIDVGFVQGHLYITPIPLVGPREAARTPPPAAVWLLSRLHPEFRRRDRAARRTLVDRPWRGVTDEWFATERHDWERRNAELEHIDVTALETSSLCEHLEQCRANVYAGYRRHFELHGDDLLPIGLLIARCGEWGIDPATAMRALDGASPRSTGTDTPPDWQIVTGYDLDCLAWCELTERPVSEARRSPVPLDLLSLLDPLDHEEAEELVADARAAVPLRDDNGALTAAWPLGLLRRAMLEAGRRLGFDDASLAVEATVDELASGLVGAGSPSAVELAGRRRDRAARSALDAPLTLGPEFAIPPLTALPDALARIGAAQLATVDHMLATSTPVGVGTQEYVGRALVVEAPALARDLMQPGDVVITTFTSPSWNVILVDAGAIVTTTGGLVSHAAVFARELGVPAVLGDATATVRFRTGDTVRVDPVAGMVTAVVP